MSGLSSSEISDWKRRHAYAGGHGGLSTKALANAIRRRSREHGVAGTSSKESNSLPAYHEALPVKSSILSRPLHAHSQMTRENLDSQFKADSLLWQRRRESFSKAAQSPAHHHGPKVATLWEQGHIASRGKGKGISQSAFDPSLLTGGSPNRPSSAPHQRPSPAPLGHEKRNHFNPILQQGEPGLKDSPQSAATRPRPATFDPILGKITHPHETSTLDHPLAPPERPPSPVGRTRVASGITWGSYNPLTHQYKAGHEPADSRYIDQEAMAIRAKGISGRQKGKVLQGTNRDQGIYNPITNIWIVPPSNPRIIQGLHFSTPTMHFSPARPSAVGHVRL